MDICENPLGCAGCQFDSRFRSGPGVLAKWQHFKAGEFVRGKQAAFRAISLDCCRRSRRSRESQGLRSELSSRLEVRPAESKARIDPSFCAADTGNRWQSRFLRIDRGPYLLVSAKE